MHFLDRRKVFGTHRCSYRKVDSREIHGLACPSENELLVADMNNWRIQKVTLHPERLSTSTANTR